jgi:glutamate/tyrosine decarboxylase-like PLP-dependent enzyme
MSEEGELWGAFLGPLGENGELLEKWVVDAIRSHVYWRRNFHPEDPPAIPSHAKLDPSYQGMVARTENALRQLDARLKRSVPWFSPRYVGHMASDLLLPGVAARILATLYNPNNVSEDAGGPTISMELEVGEQLARMFGYATEAGASPQAWGHLTSGGTVANIEALWLLRAARSYPLALAEGCRSLNAPLKELIHTSFPQLLLPALDLMHLSVDQTLLLRTNLYEKILQIGGKTTLSAFHRAVEEARCEAMGLEPFLRHHGLATPIVLAPASAHYSWHRAMKLLGLGTSQLWAVDIDDHMRMSAESLEARYNEAVAQERPILAVIGVLGTTEFGALDPLHKIQKLREKAEAAGRGFALHIDAAWGGYLASVFRQADGAMIPYKKLRRLFHYFPSEEVYQTFAALRYADTITVDPHKLGFLPYPAGALVVRNRESAHLLTEAPPYIFDGEEAHTPKLDLHKLGQFILEGSKPGSSAASVYVTHQVWPLHEQGFGSMIRRLIQQGEYLYERLRALGREIEGIATLVIPFEPDCNIICLGVNPAHNRDLATMNRLMRDLFQTMRFTPHEPLQIHSFIGSFTSLTSTRLSTQQQKRLCHLFHLDEDSFTPPHAEDPQPQHLFFLRHTLMNPWLAPPYEGAMDYLDAYLEFLKAQILRLCKSP